MYESDLSVRQVSEIESGGNPKLRTLWRTAKTLERPVDEMLSEVRRRR